MRFPAISLSVAPLCVRNLLRASQGRALHHRPHLPALSSALQFDREISWP